MTVYFNGLMLGLSLIMALGPQNVFLIRQGALQSHVALSVLICFGCDCILACASVAGLHHLLMLHPTIQVWITWFGVFFLLYYGINALLNGLTNSPTKISMNKPDYSRLQIILLALGFSLLNPHAMIDSLIIIGGGSALYPDHLYAFLFGVITASMVWFIALTFTAYHFASVLTQAAVWKRIELFSGLLMLFLSAKLGFSQLHLKM